MQLLHPLAEVLEYGSALSSDDDLYEASMYAFATMLQADALVWAAALLEREPLDDKMRKILFRENIGLGQWVSLLDALRATSVRERCPRYWQWFALEQDAGHLADAVKKRNELAHHGVALSARARARQVNSETVKAILTTRPEFCELVALSEAKVGAVVEGETFDCSPLMLPAARLGKVDGVLLFTSFDNQKRTVRYARPCGGEHEEPVFDVLRRFLLRSGFSDLEALNASNLPATERASLHADRVRRHTSRVLERTRDRGVYRPEIQLERAELNETYAAFLSGPQRLLLVSGADGSGKSSWLCSIAASRVAAAAAVFMEGVERLPSCRFPDVLGEHLEIHGGSIATVFERLGVASSDGRVLILLVHRRRDTVKHALV